MSEYGAGGEVWAGEDDCNDGRLLSDLAFTKRSAERKHHPFLRKDLLTLTYLTHFRRA